jgi:hypothetical protein
LDVSMPERPDVLVPTADVHDDRVAVDHSARRLPCRAFGAVGDRTGRERRQVLARLDLWTSRNADPV